MSLLLPPKIWMDILNYVPIQVRLEMSIHLNLPQKYIEAQKGRAHFKNIPNISIPRMLRYNVNPIYSFEIRNKETNERVSKGHTTGHFPFLQF